jgi:pimeloyl-ACP methyl ester carboxylesterase
MLLAIDHGRLAIAFDRHGDDAAPPVVLLHGLSSARTTYDAVVEHLLGHAVEHGWVQVVNVDLRGHGESSHASIQAYDAASYAADIVTLIEHLDAGPVLLVGHSLGGVVAMAVATARPDLVSRLLLEDPPLFEGDDERRAASPVASFFPLFVAAVRELHQRNADADEYEELLRGTTAPDLLSVRALAISRWDPATMEAAVAGIVWRGFDPAAPLACPITVMRADPALGAVFSADDEHPFRAGNPQAEITLIEGAAHSIHDRSTLPSYLHHLDVAVTAFAARAHGGRR